MTLLKVLLVQDTGPAYVANVPITETVSKWLKFDVVSGKQEHYRINDEWAVYGIFCNKEEPLGRGTVINPWVQSLLSTLGVQVDLVPYGPALLFVTDTNGRPQSLTDDHVNWIQSVATSI